MSDWVTTTVGELAQVKGGKRLPAGSELQARPTGNPYVRIIDMVNGGVRADALMYVPDAAANAIKNYRIGRNDIFISVAGTLGIVGRVPESLDGANLTENADRLTAIKCDVDYLMYYLLSDRIQSEIDSIRTVGAQPKLALSRIKHFRVTLPARKSEQVVIASAIREADKLIASLERLIAKKRCIKEGMMQELLTGHTRLPGFDVKWQEIRLGDHVTYVKTVALSRAQLDSESPMKYLHYGDIHTRSTAFLDATLEDMPRAPAAFVGRAGRLDVGDLVLADASEDVSGVGKSVEIVGVPRNGVVPGLHTIAARFDKGVLADGFKAYLQSIPAFRSQLLALAAGTKVLATTRRYISSIVLRLPGIDEQVAIARILGDMDAEIQALHRRLESARAIKQGMMQELLSGRTRLPVEEAVA